MNLLLDTNALIYLLSSKEGTGLGEQAKRQLAQANTVYVSAISIVEIRIKVMLGKLKAPDDLLMVIKQAGLQELAFNFLAANGLVDFPELVRHDPFDRMLLSQTQAHDLQLLTTDKVLLSLDLPYVVDASA